MRRSNDFYETPPHYVDALAAHLGLDQARSATIVEPCCGDLAIIRRLRSAWRWQGVLYTNDIDRSKPAKWHDDARDYRWWKTLEVTLRLSQSTARSRETLCITNPPFTCESVILRHALRLLAHRTLTHVAFLTRLSFIEPTRSRRAFWQKYFHMCDLITLPRHSFTGDGKGDMQTCVWLIWPGAGKHVQSTYFRS